MLKHYVGELYDDEEECDHSRAYVKNGEWYCPDCGATWEYEE